MKDKLLCLLSIFILLPNVQGFAQGKENFLRALLWLDSHVDIYYSDTSLSNCCEVKSFPVDSSSTQGYKFFKLNDSEIFLTYDTPAVYLGNIDSILIEHVEQPNDLSTGYALVNFAFLVDSSGSIIDKGLLKAIETNDYQKEFSRVLKLINGKFAPAKINGKSVCSLYTYQDFMHYIRSRN